MRTLAALTLLALLAACGGGNADEPQTAAEAASRSGTQPVACQGVTGLNCQ